VGRDGSSWAIRESGGFARGQPQVARFARKALPTRHRLLRQSCHGSLSPFLRIVKKRRVTVEPVLLSWARRHAGSRRPVTASWLQSRWRASQEARRGRSWPSGRGHSSQGSLAASLGVSSKPGSIRRLVCLGDYRRVWPRRSGNWSLQCFDAHEPPRSTRCSGNASANGAFKPGIWTQSTRCIRSPQGGRTEVSNASPSSGRTRQVASRASGDPPLLAVVSRS
jgi:hypothetical protein